MMKSSIIKRMYKDRSLSEKIKLLAQHFPAVVVSGARQVGKSTLLGHLFPGMPTIVFDRVTDIGNARRDPDLFLDNNPPPLVLDEIQYAPELLSALKRRIDLNRKPGSYLITGSQQWSVLKSISDSLAGRAVFVDLEGFSLSEIAGHPAESSWLNRWLDDPDEVIRHPPDLLNLPRTLYEQLWRGWLPDADRLPLALLPDFHAAYFRTYIERDVRLVGEAADWQEFGRFVQLTAALNGCEMNMSQLGRELSITPQTARRWLAMLSATFQWFDVPAYTGNAIKRLSSKSKGFMADTGLACHLLQLSSPSTLGGHPQAGALFESAVYAEIRKLSSLTTVRPAMYHWRTHGGAEIDLLLERDGRFFPLEIKLTTKPTRKDARGIEAFRTTYPQLNIAPGLILTPGLAGGDASLMKVSDRDYALCWHAQ